MRLRAFSADSLEEIIPNIALKWSWNLKAPSFSYSRPADKASEYVVMMVQLEIKYL